MRGATLARWAVLALILAIVFVPMYWIVATSFKTGRQILLSESVYVPRPFTVDNYVYLFEESRFALWIRNSAITAIASTLLSPLPTPSPSRRDRRDISADSPAQPMLLSDRQRKAISYHIFIFGARSR